MKLTRLVRTDYQPAAFTLIEVLVVVAIIALLLAILLPSLRQAKEQAKVAVCLANESQIAKGALGYVDSNRDRFPWLSDHPYTYDALADQTNKDPPLFSSAFGGNRSTNYGGYDDVGPAQKPVNRFIYPGKFGPDLNRTRQMPGPLRVFQCPSDDGARWDQDLGSGLQAAFTCYTDIGTSYDENLVWAYFIDYEAKQGWLGNETARARRWRMVDRIVSILRKKGPSRAVLIYEDVADYALTNGLLNGLPNGYQVAGWHNKYDFATFLFLDGHAAYLKADWKRVKPTVSNPTGATGAWVVHQARGDN